MNETFSARGKQLPQISINHSESLKERGGKKNRLRQQKFPFESRRSNVEFIIRSANKHNKERNFSLSLALPSPLPIGSWSSLYDPRFIDLQSYRLLLFLTLSLSLSLFSMNVYNVSECAKKEKFPNRSLDFYCFTSL